LRVAQTLAGLALVCELRGKLVEADSFARQAVRVAEMSVDTDRNKVLRTYLEGSANILVKRGKFQEAVRTMETQLALNRKHFPQHVASSLAWLADRYATWPDFSHRDGIKALTLAREACDRTNWNELYSLAAYAAAMAEIGNPKAASHWQRKALELIPPNDEILRRDYSDRLVRYLDGRAHRRELVEPDVDGLGLGPPLKAVPVVPDLPPLQKPIRPMSRRD
jgi:tetratricopeptide (TPR) repeat protein